MKAKIVGTIFLFVTGLGLPLAAETPPQATVTKEDKKGFWGKVDALPVKIGRAARRMRYKIADAVFDQIDSFDVIDQRVGNRAHLGLRIQRQVYDNNDVFRTYTVVDTMDTPININLLNFNAGELLGSPITFSLGIGGGVRISNIRQISRSGLSEIPSEESVLRELQTETQWYQTLTDRKQLAGELSKEEAPMADKPLAALEKESGPLDFLDALNYARFSNFFNVLTHPRKLPLRAEWLERMSDGEVMSYTGYGTASFGPGVGWSIGLPGPASLYIGASLRTFITGHYMISVLKEDERYAKVKINRGYMKGNTFHIGAETTRVDLVEEFLGTVSVGGEDLGGLISIGAKLIPFRFTTSHSFGKSFDVGYRFDMTDRRARQAYNKAVLGLFAQAEELHQATKNEPNPPVARVFERETDHERRDVSKGASLTFIFKNDNQSTNSIDDMKITLPDGRHFLYKASTAHSSQKKFLFFADEKRRYTFTTDYYVDPTGKQETGLVVEGTIDDQSADGWDLNKYSREVESVIGKNIFPRVPEELPEEEQPKPLNNGENSEIPQRRYFKYKKAYYYFRIGFNEEQLAKFIATPEGRMWPILEKVFEANPGAWSSGFSRSLDCGIQAVLGVINFPLSFVDLDIKDLNKCSVAHHFKTTWVSLKTADDPRLRAKKLDELFRLPAFSTIYLRTLKEALPGENMAYYVSAYSDAFGQIIDQGATTVIPVDRISNTFGQIVDFQRPRTMQNLDLIVRTLETVPQRDRTHKLLFSSEFRPNYVYIRVDDDEAFHFNPTLLETAVFNRGYFKAGDNEIVIKADSELPFARKLAEVLRVDRSYKIFLAMSLDGKTWGPLHSSTVRRLDEMP